MTGIRTYPKYTISSYGEFGPSDYVVDKNYQASRIAEANHDLDVIAKAAVDAGLVFERVIVEEDHAWKTIVDQAEKLGCDLICMASHGRAGLAGVVIGSETNKVLTHTRIPVLVSR